MSAQPHILIAGAGIGGLTAALALMREGFEVTLFERASELGDVGAGVQIAPNGSRILIELGLGPTVEKVASRVKGKEIRLWSTGERWPLFDLETEAVQRYGAPYWMLHRSDLHAVLTEAVSAQKPDAIVLDAECSGYRQDQDRVVLELADGREVEGDVLIGADGVHSKIRETLFGGSQAEYTGLVAWRSVIPMERLPEHLRRKVGVNWVGPGGHVVTYPLRAGQLMNFVGIVESSEWVAESWTQEGSRQGLRRDFREWHPDIHTLIDQTEIPYKWALLLREPMRQWVRGHIALLGDACHPTLPFLAQGANMAIEDGMVLGRCMAAWPDDTKTALGRYEAARQERTARIVQGANDNTERFHNRALASRDEASDYVSREWAPEKIVARYSWLFEYDAIRIPLEGA